MLNDEDKEVLSEKIYEALSNGSMHKVVRIHNDMRGEGWEIFENDPHRIFRDMDPVTAVSIVQDSDYRLEHMWAYWDDCDSLDSTDDPVADEWIDLDEMIEWLLEDERYKEYFDEL